jgi:competence protein ComEA
VKQLIPVLIAAAAGAFVLLRPLPPPAPPAAATAGAEAWSTGEPGSHGKRGSRAAPSRALVYVAGEVVRPGVYPVGPDARVRDALTLAGGAKPGADLLAVNLAAHVADGDEVAVPARGSPEALAALPGGRSAHRRRRRAASANGGAATDDGAARASGRGKHRRGHGRNAAPPAQVDINTADAETLATVPGIGGGLAERIVAFRDQNGPFASVDELLDVAGITDHRLDAMLPYVVAR